jgi:alkylation response protein AidB-like acyl-CoA dehydrogenase
MYGFDPTEEQTMLVDAAQRYAVSNLRPAAHDADEEEALPLPLIEKGWELGLLQASIPEDFGGFGQRSALSGVLAAEELAYGDMSAALAVMLPSTFAMPILVAGTDEQKMRWLPGIAATGWQPFTAAWVEHQFDFTPLELTTRAEADGDRFVLTGSKTYVPFADQAPALLVFAQTEDAVAAFVVEAGAQGLAIGKRRPVMGLGAIPLHDLTLDNVVLEARARVGDSVESMAPVLAASQVAVAAMGVGLSRAAYEYALDYAKERVSFGEPIAHKQSIAFMLAEMATEIEAIRLLVWEAAWLLDSRRDSAKSAYLALVGAGDMAMMVTDHAVQILGGHGYIREHPVERWMRNARGLPAFVGMAMV